MQQINWRKSARSETQGNCVEIAGIGTSIWVRDSKQTEGPHLTLRTRAFSDLLTAIQAGRYDR